jgi:predicted Zn-dependent peptidase
LAGWISVVAAVGHEQDVGRLEAGLDRVIRELQARSVASAELRSVQRGAMTDVVEEHESISRRARRLAHLAERGTPLLSPRETIRRIHTVTPADVRRVARKYMRADRRLVVRFLERADLPVRGEILESRGSLFPPRRPKP